MIDTVQSFMRCFFLCVCVCQVLIYTTNTHEAKKSKKSGTMFQATMYAITSSHVVIFGASSEHTFAWVQLVTARPLFADGVGLILLSLTVLCWDILVPDIPNSGIALHSYHMYIYIYILIYIFHITYYITYCTQTRSD